MYLSVSYEHKSYFTSEIDLSFKVNLNISSKIHFLNDQKLRVENSMDNNIKFETNLNPTKWIIYKVQLNIKMP